MHTNTSTIGNIGEEAVREELRKLRGSIISGFICSKNIVYYGKNFQIDFLVLVPRIGLVVLEVKKWKGKVKATSDEKWIQEYGSFRNEFSNASTQVLRTAGLLLQILEKGKINKWPIRPVVVFAHESATILKAKGSLTPQTDIILKTMIPSWLEKNSTGEVFYKFSATEFNTIKSVISEYTSDYIESN